MKFFRVLSILSILIFILVIILILFKSYFLAGFSIIVLIIIRITWKKKLAQYLIVNILALNNKKMHFKDLLKKTEVSDKLLKRMEKKRVVKIINVDGNDDMVELISSKF